MFAFWPSTSVFLKTVAVFHISKGLFILSLQMFTSRSFTLLVAGIHDTNDSVLNHFEFFVSSTFSSIEASGFSVVHQRLYYSCVSAI